MTVQIVTLGTAKITVAMMMLGVFVLAVARLTQVLSRRSDWLTAHMHLVAAVGTGPAFALLLGL